jgi:hypothetical protein
MRVEPIPTTEKCLVLFHGCRVYYGLKKKVDIEGLLFLRLNEAGKHT